MLATRLTYYFSVIIEFDFSIPTFSEKLKIDLTYSLSLTLRDNSIFVMASVLKSSNFLICKLLRFGFVFFIEREVFLWTIS